jgi:hypothetical protein
MCMERRDRPYGEQRDLAMETAQALLNLSVNVNHAGILH